jgi:hypothetical protein
MEREKKMAGKKHFGAGRRGSVSRQLALITA